MPSNPFKRIYTLGPKGTFSNEAASLVGGSGFADIRFTTTLAQITLEVAKDEDSLGVIPIENSSSGIVGPAQDSLVENEVIITTELLIEVKYDLISHCEPGEVQRFFCHSVAFNQCGKFLANHMPQAEVIYSNSNVDSGERFLSEPEGTAAIIPGRVAMADERFRGLSKASGIQDSKENTTRFLVLRKRPQDYQPDFEQDKTSIFVELHEDRHSLLFEILREFHVFGINLCRLESRPFKDKNWQYGFYIDFYNNHRSQACLEALKAQRIDFTVLGSYSRL